YTIQIGDKLYHIQSRSKVNWYQAANTCRRLGGDLLNVESSTEMQLISSVLPAGEYWISANCLAKDMDFVSLTTGRAMPYSRWQAGQPANKADHDNCVQILNGFLSAHLCEHLKFYICQAQ
ncbi:hypothetical protein KR222_000937, partial [Zaprionus bogoriensis]